MTKPVLPVLTLFFLLVVSGCAQATRTPRNPSPDVPNIKVMSYNVNYGLAGDASIIKVIESAECHVVFLQETTPDWEDALREAFEEIYPHIDFRHGRGAGGLAILSRFPFDHLPLVGIFELARTR